jgi:hypothetical protein
MSAIITLRQRRAIHVATDAASYTDDGILRAIGQKCFAFPALKMAVAGIGAPDAALLFGSTISELFGTFDDVVDSLSEAVLALVSRHPIIIEHASEPRFTLFFAGLTERGPEEYSISYWTPGHRPPFHPEENLLKPIKTKGGLSACPPLSHAEYFVSGVDLRGQESEVLERLTDDNLVMMMECQRRQMRPCDDKESMRSWIGGYCQITTINDSGIHQRIARRWDEDIIGQPIAPLPVPLSGSSSPVKMPAGVSGLNRQQRRALKAQRKRA